MLFLWGVVELQEGIETGIEILGWFLIGQRLLLQEMGHQQRLVVVL